MLDIFGDSDVFAIFLYCYFGILLLVSLLLAFIGKWYEMLDLIGVLTMLFLSLWWSYILFEIYK